MYQSNLPVTAGAFLDRNRELARLQEVVDRLAAGQPAWLAILGPRKIGKTSLLLELARRNEATGVVFVVLDSFEETPVSLGVFRSYALRLLDAVFAAEAGVSFERLAGQPSEYRAALLSSPRFLALPPDLRSILLDLPEHPVRADSLRTLLDLPEALAETLDLSVLVAWDEFQALASIAGGRAGADLLPAVRSAWQRHRRVAYVVSGSARSLMEEMLVEAHSPFFQHFELMEVGPFPRQEALRLLVDGAPRDRPVPRPVARLALDALGCHPFYLQLLGEALVRQAPPYDEAALKEALQEVLFSRAGRLALYLEQTFRAVVGRSTYLAAALRALAEGPRRLTDVARGIGAQSGSTARYLERLGDAVERTADGLYRLADPVFGLWLRWRQPGGTTVPMVIVGDEAEQRIAAELARLGFDLVYQSRASRGAFDLLATRGGRQLGVQVKRTGLPVRLGKAAWSRMEAEGHRLGWRWIVAVVTPPPEGAAHFLDPAGAVVGRRVRLDEAASIDNLLRWLDTPASG